VGVLVVIVRSADERRALLTRGPPSAPPTHGFEASDGPRRFRAEYRPDGDARSRGDGRTRRRIVSRGDRAWWISRFLGAAVLLSALVGCAAQDELPRFEAADCIVSPPEPANTDCGWLVAAADRDDPAAGEVRLPVVRVRATSPDAQPDPVVFLDGGPGGHTLAQIGDLHRLLRTPDRDLVLFDQRGAGFAQPSLRCPEYVAAAIDSADEEPDAALTMLATSLDTCAEQVSTSGVSLQAYSTRENAADVDDLRRVLGYESVNLVGLSYGTRLALAVLRDHPEGVRSVVLDSPAPPHIDWLAERAPTAERSMGLLFAACAAEPACADAHPRLEERFWSLTDRLDRDPLAMRTIDPETTSAVTWRIDGNALIGILFHQLYDASAIPRLPRMIADVEAGTDAALRIPLTQLLGALRGASHGMHHLVMCNDEYPFFERSAMSGTAEPRLERWAARSLQPLLEFCERHGLTEAAAVENEPVASDVPVLLLAGEFDPITPPSWAERASETLSASQLFVLPGVGHEVLASSACAVEMARAFLAAPEQPLDSTCVSAVKSTPFSP
jgi:pimeloyl-ACP methyl ester carboxylesterase